MMQCIQIYRLHYWWAIFIGSHKNIYNILKVISTLLFIYNYNKLISKLLHNRAYLSSKHTCYCTKSYLLQIIYLYLYVYV